MQIINSETGLRNAILQLESDRAEEGKKMRAQFHLAYESIKPVNLLKSAFMETAASQDLKDHILNTALSLTAGYLSKRLFAGDDSSSFKKLLGAVLSLGVTMAVAKNPEAVKEFGMKILKRISGDPDDSVEEKGNDE